MSTQKEIEDKLRWFTEAEDGLMLRLARAGNANDLPARLVEWRIWIQDPIIYINDLRNHVEASEALMGRKTK